MRGDARAEDRDARLFDAAAAAFERASARQGVETVDLRVAGTAVRLRFAGPALAAELVPALAHLRVATPAAPGLELRCWDAASTGVELPAAECGVADLTARGDIWGYDSPRFRSAFHWIERSVSLLDTRTDVGFFWVGDHRGLPPWVVSSPLRSLLHWWLERNDAQLVHAAAVGVDGRGALLPARGGSGKSSTALACLAAGLDYAGDDYVAVSLDPRPRVHSLYRTAKLDARALGFHGPLASRAAVRLEPGWDKSVLFLPHGPGSGLVSELAIDEVLVPVLGGRATTTLEPVDAGSVERAMAGETLAHLPRASERTRRFLARIACELPHRRLRLGTDRAAVPDAVRRALADVAGRTRPAETPSDAPTVSVLLRAHGEVAATRALVADVAAQDHPRIEVVVVNDGASPAIRDLVAELAPDARCIDVTDVDHGAESWNRAIREAFGELLVFVTHGDALLPGAVAALVAASRADPTLDVVAGAIVGSERPLGAALVRRDAFRRHGLLVPSPRADGVRAWLARALAGGLRVGRIPHACVRTAGAAPDSAPAAADRDRLREVKARLDALRRRADPR